MSYFEGNDLNRFKMIVAEINDFMLSITNEVYKDKAYKGYLSEKVDGLYHDVNCLKAMLEE